MEEKGAHNSHSTASENGRIMVFLVSDSQSTDVHVAHQTLHTDGTQCLLAIPEPLWPYSLPITVS